jgi:hypothetical protein
MLATNDLGTPTDARSTTAVGASGGGRKLYVERQREDAVTMFYAQPCQAFFFPQATWQGAHYFLSEAAPVTNSYVGLPLKGNARHYVKGNLRIKP